MRSFFLVVPLAYREISEGFSPTAIPVPVAENDSKDPPPRLWTKTERTKERQKCVTAYGNGDDAFNFLVPNRNLVTGRYFFSRRPFSPYNANFPSRVQRMWGGGVGCVWGGASSCEKLNQKRKSEDFLPLFNGGS